MMLSHRPVGYVAFSEILWLQGGKREQSWKMVRVSGRWQEKEVNDFSKNSGKRPSWE